MSSGRVLWHVAALAAALYAGMLGNALQYDEPPALALARAPIGDLLLQRFGLTYLSIRLDQILWNGWLPGLRLTNLLLHATCSALAALLALRLTARPWLAFLTGALFAVHPVHVEVVASIENRKDMLAMLFGVTSVLLYRSRAPWAFGASLLAPLLALHAKDAAAIGIVGVLPLAGLLPWPDRSVPWSERLAMTRRRLLPLLALGVVATAWFGGNLAARFRPEAIALTTEGACESYGEVLGTSAAAVPEAGRLLVYPARLSVDYPPRPQAGPMTPAALGGIAMLLLAGALALRLTPRLPVAAFAVAWMVMTYLPVSNVVPLTAFFVAERYLYVPSLGFCLLLAMLLEALVRRRAALVAIAAVLVVACAARTLVRLRDWRDHLSLWTAALQAVPEGTTRIHAALGRALSDRGRPAEAVPHFEKALALRPGWANAESDLGIALLQSGRPADAVPHFRRALAVWPRNPLIRFNLASTLLETGERDEAVAILRELARDDAWQDLPPDVHAAIAGRGLTVEEFRARVRRWLARNGP